MSFVPKLLKNHHIRFILASIFVILLALFSDFSVDYDEGKVRGESDLRDLLVVSVADGDTVSVKFPNGDVEKVRLLGVDTPESNHPNKDVECFSLEAGNFLRGLLLDKYVDLELDPSQAERDRFGRLVAYVWLDDELINASLIQEGYGFEYTYSKPYFYQSEFESLEKGASTDMRGLWAECDVVENS